MTLDPATFAFAKARLTAGGWGCDRDWLRLAAVLQSAIEDFEADLVNEYEEAQHADHQR